MAKDHIIIIPKGTLQRGQSYRITGEGIMAKASLKPEYEWLEQAILETFLAGHHEARPDLAYPESHSDMQSGIRALIVMFEIKRRPIALEWKDLFPKSEENK